MDHCIACFRNALHRLLFKMQSLKTPLYSQRNVFCALSLESLTCNSVIIWIMTETWILMGYELLLSIKYLPGILPSQIYFSFHADIKGVIIFFWHIWSIFSWVNTVHFLIGFPRSFRLLHYVAISIWIIYL